MEKHTRSPPNQNDDKGVDKAKERNIPPPSSTAKNNGDSDNHANRLKFLQLFHLGDSNAHTQCSIVIIFFIVTISFIALLTQHVDSNKDFRGTYATLTVFMGLSILLITLGYCNRKTFYMLSEKEVKKSLLFRCGSIAISDDGCDGEGEGGFFVGAAGDEKPKNDVNLGFKRSNSTGLDQEYPHDKDIRPNDSTRSSMTDQTSNRSSMIDRGGSSRNSISSLSADRIVEIRSLDELNSTNTYLVILNTIFAVGSIFNDLLSLLTFAHCYDIEFSSQYTSLILFHSIHILYVLLQLGFLQIFTKIPLRYNDEISCTFKLLKYIIALVLGTDISLWSINLLQCNGILKGGSDQDYNGEYDELKSLPNFHCNSSMFNISKEISIYLNPLELGYLLISFTILLSIFPRRAKSNDKNDANTTKEPPKTPPIYNESPEKEQQCSWGLIIGIVSGLLINVTAINVMSINIHYVYDVISFYTVKLISDFVVIIVTTLVYKEVTKFHVRVRKNLDSGYRLFYITALCGYLPLHMMCLSAVVIDADENRTISNVTFLDQAEQNLYSGNIKTVRTMSFLHSILNMISPIYQAIVLSKCHLYKGKSNCGSSLSKVREYLLWLFAINLSCWVFNSFLELNAKLGTIYLIADTIFGNKFNDDDSSPIWFIVTNLCDPITIFYRIHAATIIIGLWFNFRKPHIQ